MYCLIIRETVCIDPMPYCRSSQTDEDYLYTRWVDLCVVLVSTLLFWPVWRRGEKEKEKNGA